jgi:hypothetical protein
MFGKSWKTTMLGVLTIIGVVINAAIKVIQGQPFEYATSLAAIMAGIGLINAKDNNVSGTGINATTGK